MAGIETEGGSFLGKLWFWVVGALFSIFLFRQFCLTAATILQADIAQRDVAEWLTRHTSSDDAGKGIYIVGNDIADHDVTTGRNGGALLRTTVSATGGDVDRVVVNMVHGDVVYHDILHQSLIYFLESQAAAIHKGTVAQRDILVSAIRFRAELEAAAYPIYLFRDVSTIQECAKLVTRNHTVGNGDMLCENRFLQGIGTLQYQGIIVRCIDFSVADSEILTAVYIEAVTIGINDDIIHGAEFTSR